MIEVTVHDGGEDVVIRFNTMAAKAEDLRAAWPDVAGAIADHNRKVFATEGKFGGGRPWAPLEPNYAAWKALNWPGRSTLVRTGRLLESLTSRPMEIEVFRKQSAEVGTDTPYAKFHQGGTRHMPARPPVVTNRALSREIRRLLADYITD